MAVNLSTDELFELVYKYHPKLGNPSKYLPLEWDECYSTAPETQARRAIEGEALRDDERWIALVGALQKQFPRHWIADTTHSHRRACYAVTIAYQHSPEHDIDKVLVVCASFLAPLYFLYESHRREGEDATIIYEPTLETASIVDGIQREMASRLDYQRIDPKIAAMQAPDICVGNLLPGEVTLADALFTDYRW